MSSNKQNSNLQHSMFAVSNADGETPVYLYADPTTHGLVVSATASLAGTALPIAAATTAVGVAIVDGSGNQITSFGGGSQYTEDVAGVADPIGTILNLIRKDTPSATVTTDGDNIAMRGSNFGAGYVTLVDSSGNFVSVGGGTQYTQDAALTVGTSVGTMSMGRASAAAPTDVSADNDAVMPWYLKSGAQATVITAAGALIGGDAANGLDVDVTRLPALVAGAALIGKVGIDQTTPGTTNAVMATNLPTTVDTNSGSKSASTIRVVLATDQPALTNKLLVTPDLPTGASTLAEQQTQTTSLQLIDDTVVTLGTTTYTEATTKANVIGAVRRDADTTLVDTTNEVAPLQVNAAGQLKVALITALPAGAAAIGKLAANDGVDIGDVTINNASGGSAVNIQDGGNSITVDYATTGSGTAAGALRVELPSNGTGVVGLNAGSAIIGKVGIDQTTPGTTNLVALTAETTKVIGVTRTADGAGNLLTTNSTTPSAKFSLDSNITSILGTAPTTVGKLDVKGADGDVFVRQATASNLNMTEASAAAIKTAVETIDNAISGAGFNITQFAGTNNVTGSGTATGALRVELPTNGTGVIGAVTAITNVVHVDDNAGSLTVDGTVTASNPTTVSATLTNVASSASNVTLIASNASRKMAMLFNDSTSACYVKFGATASTSSFTVKMAAASYYELPLPVYTGIVDGIWDSANGNMRVTEL